jgi:hypothetical protein
MDSDHLGDDGPITLRLRCPEDVLSYLPYRFGYVPTDSLAVLALHEVAPGRSVLGLAARLDVADLARPDVLVAAVAGLCEQLGRDRTTCTFTVLYSDTTVADVRAGRGVGGRVLADWLAAFPFADPTATFLVTPTGFRCLECLQPPCCPPTGHRLERLSETEIAAWMVLAGHVLVPTREDLGCPLDATPQRRAAAAGAAHRELRSMRTRSAEQRRRWRGRMLDTYGSGLQAASDAPGASEVWDPAPVMLGKLSAALTDPDLRDAVVVWTLGGERLRPGSHAVLDAFGRLVSGGLEVPSDAHLDAGARLLTEVARHAPPRRAGYPLAVLGWLAWWRGEGARADVLLRQCLEDDPGNSLGRLLGEALDGGVRPGWALPGPTVATGLR